MSSAVSHGLWNDPDRNGIPRNRDPDEHLACVFHDVLLPLKTDGGALPRLSVIGVGDGADTLETFLNDAENWAVWGPCIDSLALIGGIRGREEIALKGFKEFLKKVESPPPNLSVYVCA